MSKSKRKMWRYALLMALNPYAGHARRMRRSDALVDLVVSDE